MTDRKANKPRVERLELNKETVQGLSESEAEAAAGGRKKSGSGAHPCLCRSKACSPNHPCPTERRGCGKAGAGTVCGLMVGPGLIQG
jgi:hypothetical protein